ncbi:nodulation protein NfeD [Pseudohalioglobus sediminis]|uniref:Nodulation protein NfeD n=1 Tax=Pseudohalioglobus sediminis TaxID=2606449 RepID=A0A5B0X084_9GAMM|nr:nodulation protein NfeD [Pseudohalioglobus sediminis]KAA1192008.1 nodulation protein NfeD [Pseudohalioglobus sediminis]
MNINLCKRVLPLLGLLLVCVWSAPGRAEAWLVDLEGAVGPATADHVVRGLGEAADAGAELVILRIDTPGGLDSAMRDMIKAVLASPVPVLGYVAPSGAHAASAGTYLLYATHVAAMAPGTNLGAATPIQIGSPGIGSLPSGEEDGGAASPSAMEKKIINDAVAYIQSLAQLRGRNAEWAESAVRDGASLAAEDALELGVIDLLAASLDDLLQQADGRTVNLDGTERLVNSAGLAMHHHQVDWRSDFLAVITNPNVAYILMLIGIYGLIIEFYNPGIGLPGVLGAVCLLLALYAFQVLPVSYAGLALILLGIGLMTAEAFAPSFGILGLGGVAAFVIGSVMLMDTQLPGYRIAVPVIAAFAVFSAAICSIALGLILKARKRANVSGVEHLLGQSAIVERVTPEAAWVRLDGELWHAQSEQPLAEQDEVIVDALDGLVLKVTRRPHQ